MEDEYRDIYYRRWSSNIQYYILHSPIINNCSSPILDSHYLLFHLTHLAANIDSIPLFITTLLETKLKFTIRFQLDDMGDNIRNGKSDIRGALSLINNRNLKSSSRNRFVILLTDGQSPQKDKHECTRVSTLIE